MHARVPAESEHEQNANQDPDERYTEQVENDENDERDEPAHYFFSTVAPIFFIAAWILALMLATCVEEYAFALSGTLM